MSIIKKLKFHMAAPEVVLEAVKEDCRAIEYASARLRDNEEFMLAAGKQNYLALRYASDRLRDNEEFMLVVAQESGDILNKAINIAKENVLKDTKEAMLPAVQQNWYALNYANARLRDDEEFMLAAVQQNWYALNYASDRLRDNEEIVLAAIKQSEYAIEYASERLKNDKEFMSVVKKYWCNEIIKENECNNVDEIKQDENSTFDQDEITNLRLSINGQTVLSGKVKVYNPHSLETIQSSSKNIVMIITTGEDAKKIMNVEDGNLTQTEKIIIKR